MTLELFIRYTHFIGIVCLAGMLISQNLMMSKVVDNQTLRKLTIADSIYGISALVILGAGLSLWLWVGKPSSFYSGNAIFHIKLSLFIVVGLLSIIPTVFFMRNRKNNAAQVNIPSYVIFVKRVELVLLLFIPLLAVLMARGVGLN